MAYGTFLEDVDREFLALFQKIKVGNNFDYGDEFEIALCKALRLVLPSKFGICRGFIITSEGDEAGDDIIIFDHERFPSLRLFEDEGFVNKQWIPIEAVCAYIEAKHTLYVANDGGQSLSKACRQISQVKALHRPSVPLNKLVHGVTTELPVHRNSGWPDLRNPLFCAIVSRNVSWEPNQNRPENEMASHLRSFTSERSQCQKVVPDMIIAGTNIVCLPTISGQVKSPFFLKDSSQLAVQQVLGTAFGIGVSILSWALDSIFLGTINWPKILSEGLKVPLEE